MYLQEPKVEFVSIDFQEILADTGSEIHICSGSNFGEGQCTAPGKLMPNAG